MEVGLRPMVSARQAPQSCLFGLTFINQQTAQPLFTFPWDLNGNVTLRTHHSACNKIQLAASRIQSS